MAATHNNQPSEAPLAEGDVPEQDGSEDPGVGLELNHDAGLSPEQNQSQRSDAAPVSPSAAEHTNIRGGLNVPKGRESTGHSETLGVGEGATVSHIDSK
jgi:hypothetical protein